MTIPASRIAAAEPVLSSDLAGLEPPEVGQAAGRGPDVSLRWFDYLLASLLVLVTLIALFGRFLAPYDPVQPTGGLDLPLGAVKHLLGTDSIGRDLLSRTLWGVQVTWLSALAVVGCGLVIGGSVGLVAGAVGGRVDYLLMRLTDLFLAHPGPLIVITIVAALGYGLVHTILAVTIFWWPFYARMFRGEAKLLAARPHFEAARLAGAGHLRLATHHLLPGIIPTAIVAASLDVGSAVLLLAGLSFLGLGEPAPHPELGADAARSLDELLIHPLIPLVPGFAVLALSLVGNVGGDAVRRIAAAR